MVVFGTITRAVKKGEFLQPNSIFWQKKLEHNINKDEAYIKALKKDKWKVIVVWECELEKHLEQTMKNINNKNPMAILGTLISTFSNLNYRFANHYKNVLLLSKTIMHLNNPFVFLIIPLCSFYYNL